MAESAITLLATSACLHCYGSSGTAELMRLALLRRIALSLNPTLDVSPEALLASAECYRCYSGSLFLIALLRLALLNRIFDGTSVVASNAITEEDLTPIATESGVEIGTENP